MTVADHGTDAGELHDYLMTPEGRYTIMKALDGIIKLLPGHRMEKVPVNQWKHLDEVQEILPPSIGIQLL